MKRVLGDLMSPPGSSQGAETKERRRRDSNTGARERSGEAGFEDGQGATDQQEASRSLGQVSTRTPTRTSRTSSPANQFWTSTSEM